MTVTEKWIAGSWTSAITSSTWLNSLAAGNALMSDLDIANGTNLDIYCDVSFIGGSLTSAGAPSVGIYLYPLLDNGSIYGDGRYNGAAAAGPPPSTYFMGALGMAVGTITPSGGLLGKKIPPGTFRLVVHNNLGTPFASSGNTLKIRPSNRQLV
jgi:hypothetical protein